MFVLTGVAHFVNPLRRDMIAIVPPRLPAPPLLVTSPVRSNWRVRRAALSADAGGGGGLSVRAAAGDVSGERLRQPDAERTEIDDAAAAARTVEKSSS